MSHSAALLAHSIHTTVRIAVAQPDIHRAELHQDTEPPSAIQELRQASPRGRDGEQGQGGKRLHTGQQPSHPVIKESLTCKCGEVGERDPIILGQLDQVGRVGTRGVRQSAVHAGLNNSNCLFRNIHSSSFLTTQTVCLGT